MKKVLWIALALAGLACAQETPKTITKVVPVHYVDANRLGGDVNVIPGLTVRWDSEAHVIILTGPPDLVAAGEEIAKKIDVPPVPPPNFELTGYLVSGSSDARSDEVPADLNAVVKQLHSLFSYKSYRVMDVFVMRGMPSPGNQSSNASTSGILPGTNSEYDFGYFQAAVPTGPPRSVHLRNMRLDIRTPTAERDKDGNIVNRDVGLRTDVDIPEGQKIVVGKSNFSGRDDALILVLSAKIIE